MCTLTEQTLLGDALEHAVDALSAAFVLSGAGGGVDSYVQAPATDSQALAHHATSRCDNAWNNAKVQVENSSVATSLIEAER